MVQVTVNIKCELECLNANRYYLGFFVDWEIYLIKLKTVNTAFDEVE